MRAKGLTAAVSAAVFVLAAACLLKFFAAGADVKAAEFPKDDSSALAVRGPGYFDGAWGYVAVGGAFELGAGSEELLARAAELDARLSGISERADAKRGELEAITDILRITQCLNTRELLAELDRGEPVGALGLLKRYNGNREIASEDILKQFGDIFGKRFNSSTTAYIIEGKTSSGRYTRGGTVAVDRGFVPLGARLLCIDLEKAFRADDTGGAVTGSDTDIFLNDTYANTRFWGRRSMEWAVLDSAKIQRQYEAALDIVMKYTASREEAERLMGLGKERVIEAMGAE